MFLARPFIAASLMGLLTAIGYSSDANAQQIFRIVGPDGRVTFSDKPAPEGSTRAATAVPVTGGRATDNSALPFELRQVASRYPVTLYSAPGCGPCSSGRAMLSGRGIPFTEKTVTSNEDIEALKRIAGAPSLPLLTIGGQQIKGFAEAEWTQFLDAAGYPKTSQLPSNYSQPAATPLVAAQQASIPVRATATPPAPVDTPSPSAVTADNPNGIKF